MSQKKEKILIADDMETFLRLEKMLLERSGYEIVMAKSGSEAIKKIQIEKPDLIFLDLLMPDMNGDVVCRFVKTNKGLKHLPVIMVTTKGDPESRERCAQAGADDFITKPVTQRDLFEKISKFIRVEKRTFIRTPLRVTVITSGKSFTFKDFTYDVSEGGIFVETDTPLAPGTALDVEFTLPGDTAAIRASGKIIRAIAAGQTAPGRRPGMGIQFLNLKDADVARIKEYVARSDK
ncbi:MAG TPA: TIGR02266 family protein [bacterium]|nr:TIGR02266 family protein [bacterium]